MRTAGDSSPSLDQARDWVAQHAAAQQVSAAHLHESQRSLEWIDSLGLDTSCQVAALLFSVFDGSVKSIEAYRKHWGVEVTTLLTALYRLEQLGAQITVQQDSQLNPQAGEAKTAQGIETLRRMLLALAEDVRVVMIALSRHLARLESVAQQLKEQPQVYQSLASQLGEETLKVHAPLANRLGIWQLKWALEDLAFRLSNPQAYRQIAALLDEKRLEREAFVDQTQREIASLLQAAGIDGQVAGRPKHLFSIHNKMQAKQLRFDQLMDIRAFRVLVDTESQCYSVLGLLHDHWQPVDAEFDDYITRPKANGYQSLHTVLRDQEGRPFEVQIRTHDMHYRAELGIAAHWKYKETGENSAAQGSYADKIAWLRQMLDWGSAASGPVRLSDDRIYVLTPMARIIELPKDATPLDFAYHLHTELGHRCRGAKIDGQIAPLTTALKTGQTVELITVKQGGPSRDWLHVDSGYLKSPRARQKVRSWFHAQDLAEGRVPDKADDDRGPDRAEAADTADAGAAAAAAEELILSRVGKAVAPSKGQVLVVGVDRMLTALARCCKPAPPDEIVGFVTRGRGVSVHRTVCPTFMRMSAHAPERVIATQWGATKASDDAKYLVDATVVARARNDLLRDIAEVLAREKTPLVRIDSFPKGDLVTLALTLQVGNGDQLKRVLAMLGDVSGIISAGRS